MTAAAGNAISWAAPGLLAEIADADADDSDDSDDAKGTVPAPLERKVACLSFMADES